MKKPPAPPDVEIIDSSLMAICRALATPAPVRSLGSRRKSGTCDAVLRAARRESLLLAPTKAPEPGRNAAAGAASDAQSTAAEKAAIETRILTEVPGTQGQATSRGPLGGQRSPCGPPASRCRSSFVRWLPCFHRSTLESVLGTPLASSARRPMSLAATYLLLEMHTRNFSQGVPRS